MLSITSVSLMVAAGTFAVPVRGLILGRNVLVLLVSGGLLAALSAALP